MDILFIKKVVAAFLVPPGCFISLLLISSLLNVRRGRTKTALLSAVLATAMWLTSIPPVSDRFYALLERNLSVSSSVAGDVIIVLGGGVLDSARDLTGTGVPTGELMTRVVTAVRLQKRLGVPVIVSGGSVFPGMAPEARVVHRFLRDLGVAEKMIIVEDKSRDTSGNARYCREICSRRGYGKPLLVTSSIHMRRAVAAFSREGVAVNPVPAFIATGLPRIYTPFHYLPDAGSLAATSMAMKELIGLLFYRLGGT